MIRAAESAAATRLTVPAALLRTARPRQWTKNALVAAAPAAAGVLTQPQVALRVAAALALFCVAASGTYFLNDSLDAEADRRHPRKRYRPVAAGDLGRQAALVAAALLLAAALAGAVLLGPPAFAVSVGVYVALTIAYSLWLKHVEVVDIVVVASGFILRAVAGALVAEVALTGWFLIVASFGALFVVSGKRHEESHRLGELGPAHRPTLAAYSPAFTQHLLTLSSGITIVAYCLWAFDVQQDGPGAVWFTMSVLPFVTALLRYASLVHGGQGGEPEELLLSDRGLQLAAVAWLVCVGIGIYAQ